MEIAPGAADAHAVPTDNVIIGPQKEMNFLAELAKLCAIEAPQGAATHDGDFHLP